MFHPEEAEQLLQRFGLSGKLFRGARQFFSGSGVALRHLVHLGHGAVDLLDSFRLLS